MKVHGLANSQTQSGTYALILAEVKGTRRVSIVIGTAEAQSIALVLERIQTPRPLTHDLLATVIEVFELRTQHVYIYKFQNGIFHAQLEIRDEIRAATIDCRASDAIALALRIHCKIYINSDVLDDCGIEVGEATDKGSWATPLESMNPEQMTDKEKLQDWLARASMQTLQSRLERAIEKEYYEFAKVCQEEIRRRKSSKEGTC